MKPGAEIVIATPGRLLDYLKKNTIVLNYIEFLVLDEADRMLDMGFEKQLSEIVFMFNMPDKNIRQSLLFSATFSREVYNSANAYIKDYLITSTSLDLSENNGNKNIEQHFVFAKEREKALKVHQILQTIKGKTISKLFQIIYFFIFLVFMDKKYQVTQLECQFKEANYNCIGINGDKSQDERNYAIEKFSKGEIPILIGTDVVSRGLDLPEVKYIINYDAPKSVDDYIHRIGRTGRCGSTGFSYTLLNYENMPFIKNLIFLLNKQKVDIPEFISNMLYKPINEGNDDNSNRFKSNGFNGMRKSGFGNNFNSNNENEKKGFRDFGKEGNSNTKFFDKNTNSKSTNFGFEGKPKDFGFGQSIKKKW